MVSLKRYIFEKSLSIYIPVAGEQHILQEMSHEVSESERRVFRVSKKVHESWQKYSDRLTANQYLCLVTMSYEVYSNLVEAYHNGEIDEVEFVKAIAGDRGDK